MPGGPENQFSFIAAELRSMVIVAFLGLSEHPLLSAEPELKVESPRIQQLGAEVAAGDRDAVTKFWT